MTAKLGDELRRITAQVREIEANRDSEKLLAQARRETLLQDPTLRDLVSKVEKQDERFFAYFPIDAHNRGAQEGKDFCYHFSFKSPESDCGKFNEDLRTLVRSKTFQDIYGPVDLRAKSEVLFGRSICRVSSHWED